MSLQLVQVFDSTAAAFVTMEYNDAVLAITNQPARFSWGAPSGIPPVSAVPSAAGPVANYQPLSSMRNVLDGGDFTINPWQRGTTFTGIANTATYTADRWYAIGGASSSISVSQQSITAIPGFGKALQFGRASSNAVTSAISVNQIVEALDTYRLQGQACTLSFWALAGANFSAANSLLSIRVGTGTTADQGNSGFNGSSWAGYATAAAVNAPQSGSMSPAISTNWTRYSVSFQVPANALELGVSIGYTPVGTAGANDWVQLAGVQLEIGASASPFDHRDMELELALAQRYFWQVTEPAAGVVVGSGMNTTTSAQVIYMAAPTPFRVAPTVTVSAGTFKTNQAGVATATTITAGSTHTQNAISINGSSTGTAGQATLLIGGGGAGYIQASADL